MARVSVAVCFLLLVLLSCIAHTESRTTKRAAYFTTNNPNGADIVAIEISSKDGLLTGPPVKTPTGGKGGLGLAGPGTPFVPDTLFTQDSVVVSGNYLFTINPGSSSLSLFLIDSQDPTHPKLIGKPAKTLGDFPTTLAYSSKLKTVCVANAGAKSGVACFSVDKKKGLKALDKKLRTIKNYQQTTPILGPGATVSDLLFNPSSSALFLVVKSLDGSSPGTFHAWKVSKGKVTTKSVVSSVPTLVLPFGATFLGTDSRLLVSELTFGFAILDVSKSLKLTLEISTVVATGFAICWTAYSPALDQMYIMDAAQPVITVADPKTGAVLNTLTFDSSELGAFDTRFDRRWLYVLAGDTSIAVLDAVSQQQVQNFDLSSVGIRDPWEGMAIFPSTQK